MRSVGASIGKVHLKSSIRRPGREATANLTGQTIACYLRSSEILFLEPSSFLREIWALPIDEPKRARFGINRLDDILNP